MTCNKKIINAWMLNPFLYYAVFWATSLLLYIISPSKINFDLDEGLLIFLLSTIILSSLFALMFDNHFKNRSYIFRFYPQKKIVTIILIILYISEFAYSKTVPAFSGSTYKNFGIPTLHVIIATFSIYYSIKNFFQFITFRQPACLINYLIVISYFILIFSRGTLLYIAIVSAILTFYDKKIRTKYIFSLIILSVLVCWIFGITGNIRSGYKWNDSSMILNFAQIDYDGHSIFAPFFWVEEYLTCSLRNLNYNIINFSPNYSLLGQLYNTIPDFISKRILDGYGVSPKLVFPAFTTCTMYTSVYYSLGYIGMIHNYLSYLFVYLLYGSSKFSDQGNRLVGFSMLSFVFALSTFDDMMRYSGYSFALVYCLIMGIMPSLRRYIPTFKLR